MKHSPLRKLPPPPTCFSRLFHTVVGFVFHGLNLTDFLSFMDLFLSLKQFPILFFVCLFFFLNFRREQN
jgi:hypothetical protein